MLDMVLQIFWIWFYKSLLKRAVLGWGSQMGGNIYLQLVWQFVAVAKIILDIVAESSCTVVSNVKCNDAVVPVFVTFHMAGGTTESL